MSEKRKIAILYIATGRYICFWENFYQSMERLFLPSFEKTYFMFTDHTDLEYPKNVICTYVGQLPWPGPTLKRFDFFWRVHDQLKKYDFTFFLNANMLPIREIGPEILPDSKQKLMLVDHFYWSGQPRERWPYDTNPYSTACILPTEGNHYVMGGFNGGITQDYLHLIETLKKNTEIDEQKGIVAAWHDESHLNRYLIDYVKNGGTPLILNSKYAYPQEGLNNPLYTHLNSFLPPNMIIQDKKLWGNLRDYAK